MACISMKTSAPVARMGSTEPARVQARVAAPKAAFCGSTRAFVARPAQAVARQSVSVQAAAARPMWFPQSSPPSYLDGTLPGDYGFDPLGLGSDPDRLKWYVEAELIHGRWAMIAIVGMVGPEALGATTTPWFEAGAIDNYAIPALPLVAIQFPLMGFLETKRYNGLLESGECGLINEFPFDPMGMKTQQMQTKEVKNGRLAMLAIVGFAVQALVTGESPLVNFKKHIAEPGSNNIITNIANLTSIKSYPEVVVAAAEVAPEVEAEAATEA